MEKIATLPIGVDYWLSKSELALQLSTSGRKSVTIMGPDSVVFATKVDGRLEGWVLAPENNVHPIPFAYLSNGYIGDPKWVRRRDAISPRNLSCKLMIGLVSVSSTAPLAMVSIACGLVQSGRQLIGGITYPYLSGSTASQRITAGINEVNNIPLSYRSGTKVCASFIMPIIGGDLSTDALKKAHYPGLSLIVWHDGSPLYPHGVPATLPIPATVTFNAQEVGYYDAGGAWVLSETITPTFRFYPLGTLSPTNLNAAISSRDKIAIAVIPKKIDMPESIDDAEFITSINPTPSYAYINVMRSE
jgi:hypothetical protein